uniref:tRNA (adenine(58)-N(1))-methyltransferase non-catalytic subunit TRM6 n=2 Tax=Amorphochlora amoebiformis TaxID=1561963 RepID=A0A7S0DSQ4_9EUKA|mmetsp:Transcript_8611/g.13511  ORF Transcript_8611/g.13511 Transcript_8611/m.13511 type:complete len:136 (+) Transcript_8611:113-520(+)
MGGPIGSTGIEEKKSRLYARAFEELQISCNSLIIASRFDTKAILRDLLPYVAGSSAIVVYSEAIDPLKDAINFLKTTGQAVNCNICENWFREYQILPKRTHPMMNMNGMGGYILTAIKIAHPADIPAKAESFGLV